MFKDLLQEWIDEKNAEIRAERLKSLDVTISEYLSLTETEGWWKLDDIFSKPYANPLAHVQHWLPMLFDGRLPVHDMPVCGAILNRWRAEIDAAVN